MCLTQIWRLPWHDLAISPCIPMHTQFQHNKIMEFYPVPIYLHYQSETTKLISWKTHTKAKKFLCVGICLLWRVSPHIPSVTTTHRCCIESNGLRTGHNLKQFCSTKLEYNHFNDFIEGKGSYPLIGLVFMSALLSTGMAEFRQVIVWTSLECIFQSHKIKQIWKKCSM